MTKQGNISQKVISLRMDSTLAREAAKVAEVEGRSLSDTIRVAIAMHIEATRSDDDFKARLRAQLEKDRELLESLAGGSDEESPS